MSLSCHGHNFSRMDGLLFEAKTSCWNLNKKLTMHAYSHRVWRSLAICLTTSIHGNSINTLLFSGAVEQVSGRWGFGLTAGVAEQRERASQWAYHWEGWHVQEGLTLAWFMSKGGWPTNALFSKALVKPERAITTESCHNSGETDTDQWSRIQIKTEDLFAFREAGLCEFDDSTALQGKQNNSVLKWFIRKTGTALCGIVCGDDPNTGPSPVLFGNICVAVEFFLASRWSCNASR